LSANREHLKAERLAREAFGAAGGSAESQAEEQSQAATATVIVFWLMVFLVGRLIYGTTSGSL
jgi:hypothetical protein